MTTTPREIVEYYASLMILQYLGLPRASATVEANAAAFILPQTSVQTVAFDLAPTSGAFVLSYNGVSSASIAWNDSAATIQTKLRAITGLSGVTVTGDISTLLLTVTFAGVDPVALMLVVESTTLLHTATAVAVTVTETDVTLPLAVQDGFDLSGSNIAVGNQLDIIGKYAGVTRSGAGFQAQITLGDADFLSLILMAIAKNTAGSSLADIQALLHQFFNGEILVFDSKDMRLTYLIAASVGSQDLMQLFVNEKLLPVPMAVSVAVIYAPVVTTFFSFRTYSLPAFNGEPFNSYSSYQTNWPWLTYADAIAV